MFKRLFSGSRMTRECPVRFYEGLLGKFQGSTHNMRYMFVLLFCCGFFCVFCSRGLSPW